MSIKQIFILPRRQVTSLAHVEETEGRLIVTQSNGPALRSLRNTFFALVSSAASLLVTYLLFSRRDGSLFDVWLTGPGAITPAGLIFFLSLPFLVMVFQSVNRFFGKETFIFDRNEGVFIRNGFMVGPLQEIRAVTAQVTGGMEGQYPVFRLILELPRCQMVTIVRTHDVPAAGEFHLSENGFGDPNKRFAMCTPWLNYDEQKLVPFLPSEIMALRQRLLEFIGE